MKLSESVEQFIDEKDKNLADPRGQNAKKSGAFGYLGRTERGDPIPSDLYLVQNEVLEHMEAEGPTGEVKKQALRLSSASEMLWRHMMSGPEEFNKSLRAWGWLCNSAIRAMRELVALQKTVNQDGLDLPSAMARVIDNKDENDKS